MILKQIPEDFIVDEIYDLNLFKEKNEKKSDYFYFKLTKKNYSQFKALDTVARIFNTSRKLINFAGTKDKVGITSQIISIYNLNKENYEENLKFFNEKFDDLHLEFIGIFKGRVNLGDNLGNKFKITIRDVLESEIEIVKKNCLKIEKEGVLNFFDEQRFGYANNSHIVGKFVLLNDLNSAVKEILTSMPKNPSEDLESFVNFIKENWRNIEQNNKQIIEKAIELAPKFLSEEKKVLNHLKLYKNDFPGAFKRIHKKIRTLYLNAYQSYVFNEVLKRCNDLEGEIELVNSEFSVDEEYGKIVFDILKKDNLELENFKLKSMPEIKLKRVFRKCRVFMKDLSLLEISDDELNENKKKVIISFSLESGEYATNVVKALFRK